MHEGRARHRFDAAGDGELDLAGADRARGGADRLHARGAQPVERRARHAVRQAGEQQRHARDVAVVLAGLVGAAVDRRRRASPNRPWDCARISALIGTAARSSVRTLASAPP